MQPDKIKEMLDACYMAKRIRDMLPELPDGIRASHIRFMDTIQSLEARGKRVKVSDIGKELELPNPGVTRTVKEMEAKGCLKKVSSDEDGRITYLTLTEAGEELSEKYNRRLFLELSESMDAISEQEADCMICTIGKLYQIMCERRKRYE